jgi:hypothetical protein
VTDLATLPALRRLPLPDCEPPYDDDMGGPVPQRPRGAGAAAPGTAAVQGTLALSFVLPGGLPAQPEAPPGLRLVPPRPGPAGDPDEADFGPQPTGRSRLPEPRGWAGRFVQAVVEVLAGDRPVGQLVRWTSGEVYDELAARVRATGTGAGRATARAVVRSVHVAEPADGVAEVAAMVRCGARTTAFAVRLEGLDGRWQCTAVELG